MISFSNFKSQLVSASTSAAGIELGGGGTTEYASTLEIPTSNIDTGEMAFVSETNKLYMWNGSAWFNIAMVNQAPTAITGNQVSYELATNGTPTTVTLVSTDPEGLPLTWSATTSGDTQVGTVTNTDNVFTITPSTDEANAGTLSVTFSVTDGNNTENSTSTFTLVFAPDWSVATQQAKVMGASIGNTNQYGYSVDIDEDTAIVGCPFEDTSAANAGAAYIFTRSGSTWTQQARIVSSDIYAQDRFGYSVAISGDTVVVGSYLEDTGATNAGAAYIFTRSGSTWTQQAKIQASDKAGSDYFGWSVDIDGDTVIVGAYREDTGASDAGAAYIFTRSGSTWTQQAKIQASDKAGSDQFGYSVAISGDNVIVGAIGASYGSMVNAGAAYIFTRSGSTWTQQALVNASIFSSASQYYGWSVDIDGDTAIVGARLADTGGENTGAVHIYTRSGSTWTQQQRIQSSDIAAGDEFGYSVAIYNNFVAIGAPREDTKADAAGAVYIFTKSGSTWAQTIKLLASDGTILSQLGGSISISDDTMISGAPGMNSETGAAYIFIAG